MGIMHYMELLQYVFFQLGAGKSTRYKFIEPKWDHEEQHSTDTVIFFMKVFLRTSHFFVCWPI